MTPGWSLEPTGNGGPRGMIATGGNTGTELGLPVSPTSGHLVSRPLQANPEGRCASGRGRERAVDAAREVLADRHRLADDLPQILERAHPRALVVAPGHRDLVDAVAAPAG